MPYKDRAQRAAYQNAWKKQRRDVWFAENGPCVDCGSWDELRLDHVDPASKIDHKIWTWSEVRRLAELAKCVVRCFSCHVIKTKANREHVSGEKHHFARLSTEQVLSIRARVSLGEKQSDLAREFEVHKTVINRIVLRRTRKYE